MALIRQLVTEYCIFPLGSELVKQRVELTRSVLFYGPPGTGKTLVARSIAHETASMVFDLSPLAIDDTYTEPKGEQKLVASVMKVAKHYQPAVVYIDECEKVFPGKKKKKKKKKKGGAAKGGKGKKTSNAPSRIKKTLITWRKKFLKDDTWVLIVGCSSEPHEGSKKDMKTFFDKHIFFPHADYSTRRLMWKKFIEDHGGKLWPNFPLSTLAHISVGYSAGSVSFITFRSRKHVKKFWLHTGKINLRNDHWFCQNS